MGRAITVLEENKRGAPAACLSRTSGLLLARLSVSYYCARARLLVVVCCVDAHWAKKLSMNEIVLNLENENNSYHKHNISLEKIKSKPLF